MRGNVIVAPSITPSSHPHFAAAGFSSLILRFLSHLPYLPSQLPGQATSATPSDHTHLLHPRPADSGAARSLGTADSGATQRRGGSPSELKVAAARRRRRAPPPTCHTAAERSSGANSQPKCPSARSTRGSRGTADASRRRRLRDSEAPPYRGGCFDASEEMAAGLADVGSGRRHCSDRGAG
jgi:hypothetical protein